MWSVICSTISDRVLLVRRDVLINHKLANTFAISDCIFMSANRRKLGNISKGLDYANKIMSDNAIGRDPCCFLILVLFLLSSQPSRKPCKHVHSLFHSDARFLIDRSNRAIQLGVFDFTLMETTLVRRNTLMFVNQSISLILSKHAKSYEWLLSRWKMYTRRQVNERDSAGYAI